MVVANNLLNVLRGMECAMCGFKTRLPSRFTRHVKEFPNCAFTEESFVYLNAQRSRS